jgi:hypothetical protein
MPSQLENTSPIDGLSWYLAELILRITVEGDGRNVSHKNLTLIRASSAADAYDKATIIGEEHTMSYLNPQGRKVQIQFMGLSRLNVVYDRLQHGAELLYEEHVDIPDKQLREWVIPKHLLSVFRKAQPPTGPDYSSAEVLDKARKLIGGR